MLSFGTGIVAAFAFTAPACHEMRDLDNNNNKNDPKNNVKNCQKFQKLCKSIGTSADNGGDLLKLTAEKGNDRGVRITQRIDAGSEILRIPLSKCLRDDRPPEWLDRATSSVMVEDDYETHVDKWSTRLAASLIDLDMNPPLDKVEEEEEDFVALWKSLLPDPSTLRASLPVHWSDEALASTQCAALELASDAAFFARAEAVNALLDGIAISCEEVDVKNDSEIGELEVQQALDLVQTRSCRVRRHNGVGPALRLLAPVFDFINHGSALHSNAVFDLEDDGLDMNYVISADVSKLEKEPALVVRASRDIDAGEEILIDYGDSARPEWKCLSSYGFVPKSCAILVDDFDDEVEDCSSAEIYMDGKRYEIGPSIVPTDLVLDVADTLRVKTGMKIDEEDSNPLTADVALSIAKRVSDVAGDLLDFEPEEGRSPAEQQAFQVASQLRRSQHDILISCAAGLRDYAASAA